MFQVKVGFYFVPTCMVCNAPPKYKIEATTYKYQNSQFYLCDKCYKKTGITPDKIDALIDEVSDDVPF